MPEERMYQIAVRVAWRLSRGMMGEGEGVVAPERRRAWRARATSWMIQTRVQ
jgi:hypothetical protein